MAKKKETKKEESTKKVEKKLNVTQASIHFKLNFYDRQAVKIKYKNKEMTEKQWVDALGKDNINFVF